MGLRRTLSLAALAVLTIVSTGCAVVIESSVTNAGNPVGGGDAIPVGRPISRDGRYVVFLARAASGDFHLDAYRHDNTTGATVRVSNLPGGGPAHASAVSLDPTGRYVVFVTASALVAGDTNAGAGGGNDVYLRDMTTGAVTRESLLPDGSEFASNTVNQIYGPIFVSDDARYVSFKDNTAGPYQNLYVRDRSAATTTRAFTGSFTFASMSGNGLHLAISPGASGGDSWVIDWTKGSAFRIGECAPFNPQLSRTGRFIAYFEAARAGSRCVGGTYRLDRQTWARVDIIPADSSNLQNTFATSVSADGRRVAVMTNRSLRPEDQNGENDIYVRDLWTGDLSLASADALGASGPYRPPSEEDRIGSIGGALSGDGNYLAFTSDYPLATTDTNGEGRDVYTVDAVRPEVSGVAPGAGAGGATGLVVTVAGHGFMLGTVGTFGAGVTVTNSEVLDAQTLRFTVTIDAHAAAGPRTVAIWRPGRLGRSGATCGGCFHVT